MTVLKLRSELEDFERVTLEEWRNNIEDADGDELCRVGNQVRYELLDGADKPQDVEERGYFEEDYRGVLFILEALQDPTWETVMMASSMHCGGFYDEEAFEKAVTDFEVSR
jgi:hypothetical protein